MDIDLDAFEAEVVESFVPMEQASREVGRRFLMGGGGFDKHDAARSVAPEWLRKWNDDHNWVICFANGYRDLLSMANAFGYSRERFLSQLLTYRNRYSVTEPA